jgi:hypothetical protein
VYQQHAVLNHHPPQEGLANGVREENSPNPLHDHFASSAAHLSSTKAIDNLCNNIINLLF